MKRQKLLNSNFCINTDHLLNFIDISLFYTFKSMINFIENEDAVYLNMHLVYKNAHSQVII